MGSVVGAAVSYSQYQKQKKEMRNMEKAQEAAEEEAKRLTPADARMPDIGDDKSIVKRRGIQSTFTTSKKNAKATGG
jgi:hypothetical protein